MKLTCPECQTSYAVAENALGDAGRTVRCVKCKHQWFAEAEKPAEEAIEPEISEESLDEEFPDIDLDNLETADPAALPNLSEPASQKAWMLAAVALFFLAFISFIFQARESLYSLMPSVYHAVGYYPNQGVVLANVTIKKQKARRKQRYEIGCVLLNTADTPQMRPPVAMRILSAGGNPLAEDDAYLAGGTRLMEPGEQIDCGKLEVVHKFASADKLLLEIASPLEMGLRSGWTPDDYSETEQPNGEKEHHDKH